MSKLAPTQVSIQTVIPVEHYVELKTLSHTWGCALSHLVRVSVREFLENVAENGYHPKPAPVKTL